MIDEIKKVVSRYLCGDFSSEELHKWAQEQMYCILDSHSLHEFDNFKAYAILSELSITGWEKRKKEDIEGLYEVLMGRGSYSYSSLLWFSKEDSENDYEWIRCVYDQFLASGFVEGQAGAKMEDLLAKREKASLFFQEDDVLPRNSWQAAYDERFFNEDGTKVIGSFFEQDNLDFQETRVVFFLYFTDFTKPLLTQFGVIKLPEPSPMPDRLAEIIEFIPAD